MFSSYNKLKCIDLSNFNLNKVDLKNTYVVFANCNIAHIICKTDLLEQLKDFKSKSIIKI